MGLQTDPMGWAQTMFGECKLADKRLTRRLVHTMAQLARQGGYRLLRNTQVSISGKSVHSGKSTAIAEGRGREAVCPLYDDLPPIPDGVALRRDAEYSP